MPNVWPGAWILMPGLVPFFCSGISLAQDYPNKPIRVVTSGAGGAPDIALRLIAFGVSGTLGQNIIVDNRSSGFIPAETVAKAPRDGYTLLTAANSMWIGPLLGKAPYDPVRDFSPITLVATAPNILVVHPAVAAKSVKELVILSKARPGTLNYASTADGSSSHLAGELFKSMAGINMVRVPYKNTGVALGDLIGGQVQLMFSTAPPVMPHVKSGRLTALAITSLDPSELFAGLPTVAAAGLPDFETVSITGLFAPARTPAAVIKRLNQEIVRFLGTTAAKDKFAVVQAKAVGSSPEQLAAAVKTEMHRMGKIIQDAGIKSD